MYSKRAQAEYRSNLNSNNCLVVSNSYCVQTLHVSMTAVRGEPRANIYTSDAVLSALSRYVVYMTDKLRLCI